MGTSYVAHADRPRSRSLPVGLLLAGLLAVSVAAAAMAPRIGTLGQRAITVSAEQFGYGPGNPSHGGLAGPSRLTLQAEHPGYGAGYPQHGGLAGPSHLRVAEHVGYGPGYPLHGGLAGPSQPEPAP
jgi:hypothetical protein